MKRKKRYPRVMVTLLLLLAIVLIILLFRHIAAREAINTFLFKTTPTVQAAGGVAEVPAAPAETQPAETPAPAAPAETQPAETPAPAAPAATGNVVDTGIIRTVCPDGWYYIELTDVFGEKDENGNYPVDPARMGFCKGATSQMDIFSKLSTYAYLVNTAYTDSTLSNSAMWYSDTENFTTTINGVACEGFHAKEEDLFSEGEFYEYDFIFMPIDDGHHVQFQIMTAAPNVDDTVSRDDPDVQQILTNFAVD
ncbi:MAG: hypothetical protein IKG67_01455 [Parasporobacterium sp.]|nr:hypothetical protein [Parasporobacterium sp.]